MEDIKLFGTLVNVVLVIVGSLVGLGIGRLMGAKKSDGNAEKDKLSDAIFSVLALCVLAIGVQGVIAVETPNDMLAVILSLVLGATVGHLCRLDDGINRVGAWVERTTKSRGGSVAQGFVSATLLFCVGSMAVVGSLNSGLLGDHTMIYAKSIIDMFSALVLSISLGLGVALSAVALLVYQGSITLLAQWISPVLSTDVVRGMSVAGSILIVGLSLNMLGLTKLKITNYLPAVFVPIAVVPLVNWVANLL